MSEDEQQDLRILLNILETIDPWVKVISSHEPSRLRTVEPRSPLATDDARTYPYCVSHRAWLAINPAVDFLACLRSSIIGERQEDRLKVQLHPYAQAGLIRGALENACCAVWLLGPPRMERVTNRLSLEWKELSPAYRLRELAGGSTPRTSDERKQQLIDLLLAAHQTTTPVGETPAIADRVNAKKALRGLTYVTIVRRAGELSGAGADLAEATWSMCSGLAHGDANATLGILDTKVVQQIAPGISLARVSPQVKLLVLATKIACRMTGCAFQFLNQRGQAPY